MSRLHPITEPVNQYARGDVVFVHGTDGNWRTTWMADKRRDDSFWPAWLASDLGGDNVWCLEYDARSLVRGDEPLPLSPTANKALGEFYGKGLGKRRIVFICHSFGGLAVKKLLQTSHGLANPHWKPIAQCVRGVVFFGTPHEGSDHATYASYLSGLISSSAIAQEQRANAYNLLELAQWYRDNAKVERVGALVYTERDRVRLVGTIVKRGSADPGLPGAAAVEIDADHIGMCKLPSREGVYEQVLRFVDERLAQEHGGFDAVAPAPPPPFTIPASVNDFTGREPELAELATALTSNSRAAICAVNGMGGVGKSQLAFETARRMAASFPDGRVYLDLRGTAPNPLAPEAALADLIRAAQPDARTPADLPGLKALYHQAWHGRRALLLLDNARDEAQLHDLAPPAPAAMLVTSRRQIVPDGGRMLRLDVLPEPQALTLLSEVLGTARTLPDADARALAQACGRLPLALRAAAKFLLLRRAWTVAQYLAELRDYGITALGKAETNVDEKVETVLGLSVDRLADEDGDLARRFTLLAAFPAGFDASAAAAVLQSEPRTARDHLDILTDWSLVQVEADDRYRLHDLVRDLANKRADTAALDKGRARHAEHYCRVLARADDLYLSGRTGVLSGLALFDAERVNIEAGHRWAVGCVSDRVRSLLVARYPDAGIHVLNLRFTARQTIEWLTAALDACRSLADRSWEGNALGNLGTAWVNFGDAHKAIGFHEKQLAIAKMIGDRKGEAVALANLGIAWRLVGHPGKALGFHRKALAVLRPLGDRRSKAGVLGNVGTTLIALGKTRKAVRYFERNLAIARRVGDLRGESNALGNLGIARCDLGNPVKAIELFKKQLVITQEIGDQQGTASAFANCAIAYEKLGERGKAIESARAALAIDRMIEGPHAVTMEAWLRDRGVEP